MQSGDLRQMAEANQALNAPLGTVYYTLDGTDPRAPGGGIAPAARPYAAPFPIDRTTRVIARALEGSLWSALPAAATFNIAQYAGPLRITEIMYHPAARTDGRNLEFIELFNRASYAVDLTGWRLRGASWGVNEANAFHCASRWRSSSSSLRW